MPNLRSRCWKYIYVLLLASFFSTAIIPTAALAGPMVEILQPTQGQTVSGAIWIDVSYSTNSDAPIAALELYINDQLARRSNLASPEKSGTRSFQWDFSMAAASTHTISAKAIDTAGASGMATMAVTVQRAETVVQPGVRDTIPPTVNVYYPGHGAKLSGMVEIRAEARDNAGVQAVYFYIDGRLHKMIYNVSPPYYAHWDTTRETDGTHVLEAAAVDAAGNEGRSAQVTVIVENHSMTRMDQPAAATGVQPQTATEQPPPTTPAPELVQPEVVTPAPAITPPPVVQPKPSVADRPEEPVVAAEPRSTTPAPDPGVTSPTVESPSLAVASAPNLGGQERPVGPTAVDRQHHAPVARSSSPARTLPAARIPAPTVTTEPRIATAPNRPAAVAPRPASDPIPAHGTLAMVRDTLTTTPRPPTTPPTVSDGVYGPLQAQPATDADTAGHLQIAYDIGAAGPARGAQRVSTPLIVDLPPAAQPVAAALDAGIPELRLITQIVPGGAAIAEPAGQRTTAAALVQPLKKAAPTLARDASAVVTEPQTSTQIVHDATVSTALAPQRTTLMATPSPLKQIKPAVAEAVAAPPAAHSTIALAPRTSAPDAPTRSAVSRPAAPDLSSVIAESPVRDITIVYDGTVLDLRAAPETMEGIATGPLRELFERSDGVLYWFPTTKEVRAIGANGDLHLTIGDPLVQVNGASQQVPVAPYIKQGRTMLPLQFIADMMDLTITYEPKTQQIIISTNSF